MSDTEQLEREVRRLQAIIVTCYGVMHTAAVMLEEGHSRGDVAEHLERGANGAAATQPAGDRR
ncbi:hypothetical protein BJF79_03960 [Actinomadura sp. CNU-125]|uniref:hypothetical protein n=1 Tax=Actinomadura sp. CNU-125 TaxID=1904961 RepID=UPI0009603DDE|nr:hypothetical protein [Actinomadura sp. CNU-125]OLT13061.1 hypothetical protein BJF79_03960 [Actinomadura sp. CNU-125]